MSPSPQYAGEERPSSRPPAVPKQFKGGTHRVVSPAETIGRVRPLLPILGITRIADVTGLDDLGIPVVMVIRPNSRSISVSPGKGADLWAARASGVMESIEHWHAEHIQLPLKLGSVSELRFRDRLVDVRGLPRVSVNEFHDNLRVFWVTGIDLVGGAPTWVPFEVVHTDYTVPIPAASGAFVMSSNGLASGNHPLEAMSHAICELVERDAATLWHLSGKDGRQRSRVDLSTVDDPTCRDMLERVERAGALACIWELTSDIGIAAFRCTLVDRDPNPLRPIAPMVGFGCHPARSVALLRAITEAAQTRLTVITGARDDVRVNGNGPKEDLLAAQRFLEELGSEPAVRAFHDAPDRGSDTLDEDLAFELDSLRAAGLEQVIAVDLSRSELGIPVIRMVIPGLETLHDTPGFVPGARARRRISERMS